jgi:hypothetical protein
MEGPSEWVPDMVTEGQNQFFFPAWPYGLLKAYSRPVLSKVCKNFWESQFTNYLSEWSKAFIDQLRAYFRLNHRVPAYQSFLTRIALTLTLIQGPLVQEWVRHPGDWLDRQDPLIDNIQGVWEQFEQQFLTTFTDTQRDQRARNQLESLKMKWPKINQYTMDFTRLMREAGAMVSSVAVDNELVWMNGIDMGFQENEE